MPSSSERSSETPSQAFSFKRNTFYAFPSKAHVNFEPKGQYPATEEEIALSNIDVWAPDDFKNPATLRNIEWGTGNRLTELGRTTVNEVESFQARQTRQKQKQHHSPISDLNDSLFSALRNLKAKKSTVDTYDLEILDGDVAPSRSDFKAHNFVKVSPRQLSRVMYGIEEEMRRIEGEQTAVAEDKDDVSIVDEELYH